MIFSLQSIALQLGLQCVVEGVETPSIIDTLASSGNELQQGYVFAKPLPISGPHEWLHREAEGRPLGPFPQSLYSWFNAHMTRTFHLGTGLLVIPDLIDINATANAETCALHSLIHAVGGDEEVVTAHYAWHADFAKMAKLAQSHRTNSSRLAFMDILNARKATLRTLIERKLAVNEKTRLGSS